jgi:hypothetical protein
MLTELTTGRGTIEGRKDILVKNHNAAADDANGLMKEVANSSTDGFTAARGKAEQCLSAVRPGPTRRRTTGCHGKGLGLRGCWSGMWR